jgi:flagellar biosynthesis chaperone FliJ
MKHFHYKQEMVKTGAQAVNVDRIEMLKRQINTLKNCIDKQQ